MNYSTIDGTANRGSLCDQIFLKVSSVLPSCLKTSPLGSFVSFAVSALKQVWAEWKTLKTTAPPELMLVYVSIWFFSSLRNSALMIKLRAQCRVSLSSPVSSPIDLLDFFLLTTLLPMNNSYGLWGFLTSVYGFFTGVLMDNLGVKWSLIVGTSLCVAGRFLLAVSSAPWSVYLSLYFLQPLGMSLGIPVLTIAIKRYTNEENRTFAFSTFYAVMNVAALIAGPATDILRYLFKDGVWLFGIRMSAIRLIFLSGSAASVAMLIIALRNFREIAVDATGNVVNYSVDRSNFVGRIKDTVRDYNFWRLMLFSLLIMATRLLFRHLDATFPKYFTREMGKDAAYGTIYSINPLMIIILVPVIGLKMKHVHPFKAIVDGSWTASASPLWLILGASYFTAAMFVVTLSIGEAIYSPRVYDFTMMISPEGNEGLYSSLASLPLFGAKFLSGYISGFLLEQYCPPDIDGIPPPARNSRMMWFIIALISLSSPVLMKLLQRVIVPGGTEDFVTPGSIGENNGAIEMSDLINGSVVSTSSSPSDKRDKRASLLEEEGAFN